MLVTHSIVATIHFDKRLVKCVARLKICVAPETGFWYKAESYESSKLLTVSPSL